MSGFFVWRDLMTTDPDAAKAFYTELFGWKTVDADMGPMMGMYTMFTSDGTPETSFAGVVKLDADAGLPSHWIDYISVEDVDAACEQAKALGGEVSVAPFDMPNVGRTAVVRAPGGEFFSPFKSANPDFEFDTDRPADFTFCWAQLLSRGTADDAKFYATLFGWKAESMGEGLANIVFKDGERPAASMLVLPPEAPSPANWTNYVAVPDVQESFDKAVALGAKAFHAPEELPGMGTFAVFASPDGAAIALWKDRQQG